MQVTSAGAVSPLMPAVAPTSVSSRPVQAPVVLNPVAASDRLSVTAAKGIPALAPLFQTEAPLPPISVETRDNFTYYRNAFGVQITQVDYADGKYFYLLSQQGLAVMLRQHDDKRDTLNFTDMNFNIPKPSQFPNVYFHVQGEVPSRISFNERHEVVLDLSNGEQLIFDREKAETPLKGPYSLRFNPDEAGHNFDAIYSGSDTSIKRYKSKGDSIQW